MPNPVQTDPTGAPIGGEWKPPAEPWETNEAPPAEFQAQADKRTADVNWLEQKIYANESSSGQDLRTSSAGARGPMQIIPPTWKQYAQPGEQIDNFNDNRHVGRRIIEDLYDRYNGDPTAVLVGYNAGEGHIGQPFEQLPRETQNYLLKAQGDRPVPPPAARVPKAPGPQNLGPFRNQSEAYEAAPQNRDNYYLLGGDGPGYSWVPKTSVGAQPGAGPSPYFDADTDRQINNQGIFKAQPQSIGNGVVNIGRSINGQIAHALDLPSMAVDLALRGMTAGLGRPPLEFQFGHPVENLMNKLGIETESKGTGWAANLGSFVGNGIGAALPFVGAGEAGAALGGTAGNLIARGTGISAKAPLATAANETAMGAASGIGQGMAGELYQNATGRQGDVGDVASQIVGGTAANLTRIPLLAAAEAVIGSAIGKGWQAAKNIKNAGPLGVLDPNTGRQVADAVLSEQLTRNLDIADQHVAALGTVSPADSVGHMAEKSTAARQAVMEFAKGSRADEAELWSPTAGVNLAMPRDFTKTQGLLAEMKSDHFDPDRIRNPESWPVQAEKLVSQLGAEGSPIDNLGRGQDVRSRIGQMIEDESAVQGRAADAAKLGYLKRLRSSLTEDMSAEEGANPQEIDAYRRAMAFSASRSRLMESPEMQQFLASGESSALEKMVKQGQAGADAMKILNGVAQMRYGSDGLLGAAKDVLRQKYTNQVAPYGYVNLRNHDRFMQQYGGLLSDPSFGDVRSQLETAAAAEGNVSPILAQTQTGGGRGFGVGGTLREVREDRAQHYLNAPMDTVMTHLEGVSDKFSATRKVFAQLDQDSTGQASLGFQHVVADRILQPDGGAWLAKHAGIVEAVDRVNPGFAQAAKSLTDQTTTKGAVKGAIDWGLSYVGAQAGGKAASHMGSSMVMAGRSAQLARDVGKLVSGKILGLNSAMLVDPALRNAWGRVLSGTGGTPAQSAADFMLLHSYVPGLALSNLPTGSQSGTGAPGSPPNPAGPPNQQGPGGQPWYKSLPSYAPGAGRM